MNLLPDSTRLDTPVGRIAVRDTETGPHGTVVLLHGLFLDGATNYAPAVAALAGYRVVCIDLLGHGGTIRSVPCSNAANAAAVHAVLEHLAVTQPILVGYSYGGVVAHEVAAGGDAAGVVYIATAGTFTERPRVASAARQTAAALRWVPALPWRPLDARTLPLRRVQLLASLDGAGVLTTALTAVGLDGADPVWRGPSIHVVTTGDLVVAPGLQRAFAERTGGTCIDVDGGHFIHRDPSFPAIVRNAVDRVCIDGV
jgi:pimeloyl-ACP methyl ester carboxylesterase